MPSPPAPFLADVPKYCHSPATLTTKTVDWDKVVAITTTTIQELKTTWMSSNRAILWKQKLLFYIRWPYPTNRPLEPLEVKKDPKIRSKLVNIKQTVENKSWSSIWIDLYFLLAHPNPKNRMLGPQNDRNDSKFKSKKKLELKELLKIKVVQLHEYMPKQFWTISQPQK